jgi:hypothetical protein
MARINLGGGSSRASGIIDASSVGRSLLQAADKVAARVAAGFVTGTPGAGEVQLVDAATLLKVKSFGLSAPPAIGSSLAVVNSTAETAIASWNIASGDLAAGDVLSLTGSLDVLNNSGVAATAQFRVRVGSILGTAILASTAISHASSGSRYRWTWDLRGLLASLTDHRWSGYVGQSFASSTEAFNQGTNSFLLPTALSTADLSGSTSILVTAQLGNCCRHHRLS